jgi:hypothetical protein
VAAEINNVKVHHPDHYKRWKMDPVSYCAYNKVPFLEGNVIKYVMRHDAKDGVADLLKAKRYIDIILESHYGVHPDGTRTSTSDWSQGWPSY